jgi:hypothetical protein
MNSTSDLVTSGAQSFLTTKTFRGGAGHWRERRSFSFDSIRAVYDQLKQHHVDCDAHLDNSESAELGASQYL